MALTLDADGRIPTDPAEAGGMIPTDPVAAGLGAGGQLSHDPEIAATQAPSVELAPVE